MRKLITYLARPFEQSNDEDTKTGTWVSKINKSFDKRKIYVYDAAQQEAVKTKENLNKHIDSTHVMFIEKDYKVLEEEMNLIWFNSRIAPIDIACWKFHKRHAKLFGTVGDPNTWGDYEAVLKSDFIIARIPYPSITVGTYQELETAADFGIPIYLIIPDLKHKSRIDKSKAFNKSLFRNVVNSGGKWFWCVGDCIKHVKKHYKV